MPLPKPNSGEDHDDFIDRCMSDEAMLSEYPDNDQRLAVCETQWDSKSEDKAEKPKVEKRVVTEWRVENDDGNEKLVGYAARFNKWSEDLGFFREKIAPGAFANALKTSDVRALKNHDPNLLLGRSESGTLRLTENSIGLRFEVDVPNTTTGRDCLEEIRRGDITGCSFSFTVASDTWNYPSENSNDPVTRTINEIERLFDVGPVTFPAYPDTTVAARMMREHLPVTTTSTSSDAVSVVEQVTVSEQRSEESESEGETKGHDWTFDELFEQQRLHRKCLRRIEENKPAES